MNILYVIVVILIIVALFFYIHHTISMIKVKKNGGRIIIEDTFNVEVKEKTEDHKYHGEGSDDCFYINDEESPILYLKRGKYYEFINNSDEPLYFTTDDKGGNGSPGSLAKNIEGKFEGHGVGTIFFKASNSLPEEFYYQSGYTEYMGGLIKLV